MPNDALEDAYKEALALAPTNVVHLHTLEISHPDKAVTLYLVCDRQNHTLVTNIVGPVTHEFTACSFRIQLPSQNDQGVPEMPVAMDDTDNMVTDWLKPIIESQEPVTITYRPYLAQFPTVPQMNPPLILYLRDARKKGPEVVGRATFADIVNKKFLTELYTRERFPSLGNRG